VQEFQSDQAYPLDLEFQSVQVFLSDQAYP
jgi:hypothetical protein